MQMRRKLDQIIHNKTVAKIKIKLNKALIQLTLFLVKKNKKQIKKLKSIQGQGQGHHQQVIGLAAPLYMIKLKNKMLI